MAAIGITPSTQAESTIVVSGPDQEGECMSVTLNTNIMSCGEPHPYSRDTLYIHGTIADMRVLFEKMLAALPAAVPVETAEEVTK